MPFVRAALVILLGGLLAFQAVRTAAVRSEAGFAPLLWPDHPNVSLERTMAEIGTLAARGLRPSPSLLAQVDEVARRAPLLEQPFLIKGAVAQSEGRVELAERLFLEARARDPQSQAARYFLADRFLRTGRVRAALTEIAVFARLSNGVEALAPSLAAYARSPGAIGDLKQLFRQSPELEPVVLSQLASDPRNVDVVLALWSGRPGGSETSAPEWQGRLVDALVERGEFGRAHRVWSRFAGVPAGNSALFNPEFRKMAAPRPFNWTFGSAGGVAEPLGAGRLQLLYFGREDAMLAEQLLLLEPGRYRIGMSVSGDVQPGALMWTLECQPGGASLLRLPVTRGQVGAQFTVPPGCAAQRLRLVGAPGEFPRSTEATLSDLSLVKAGGA